MKKLAPLLISLVLLGSSCVSLHSDPVIEFAGVIRMYDETGFLTNASPILKGDTFKANYDALAQASPCPVTLGENMEPDLFGRAVFISDRCWIFINARHPVNTQFQTLLHEETHVLIRLAEIYLPHVNEEVLAEVAAVMASRAFGLNSSVASAKYLRNIDPDVVDDVLRRFTADVHAWTDILVQMATPKESR